MNARECLEALASACPGVRYGDPRPIVGGWSFWTFAVDDLIVRFPLSDGDAAGLEREFQLLPVLGETLPVSVPNYVVRGEWNGKPFGAYRAIPGVRLDDGAFQDIQDNIWETLGTILRKLHDVPVAEVERLVGGAHPEDTAFWESVYGQALPLLPPDIRDLAEAGIERHRASAALMPEALTHSDLGLVHILAEDGRITGIIDWTAACIGDPVKDFVGLLARGGWQTVRKLARTYGSFDSSFEDRLAFYAWLAPVYDIFYGISTGQPEHVTAGIEGVERRMRLVGVLGSAGPNRD